MNCLMTQLHLWEVCETAFSTTSVTPSNEGIYYFGVMVFIRPGEVQTLVESMPRNAKAVLQAHAGPTPHKDTSVIFL